ncbi:MAG TPA: cytidylate kinase-like family protein [Vicinamibacteria bacterium]|nr:cytidylate kinase-like family protein [Vicinamibacteria bacterium]
MPIVTISRGSMSGGRALAECVSGALAIPCLGREILVETAARLGVPEKALAEKMEKGPGLWDRFTLERHTYLAALRAALAEHALQGDLVYHGLAGHLLLRGAPAVLRVRLIAPLDMRVRAVMEQQGLGREEAEKHIRKVDEDRLRWTKFMYDVHLFDPHLYDLVVNLEELSMASACALVVEAARRPEFSVTGEVRAKLQDFALASRVRLALITQPATRSLELSVRAAGGVVTVGGEVPEATMLSRTSTRWEQELRQVVQGVPGVERLVLDVQPVSPYR